jgi:hypothetical protein
MSSVVGLESSLSSFGFSVSRVSSLLQLLRDDNINIESNNNNQDNLNKDSFNNLSEERKLEFCLGFLFLEESIQIQNINNIIELSQLLGYNYYNCYSALEKCNWNQSNAASLLLSINQNNTAQQYNNKSIINNNNNNNNNNNIVNSSSSSLSLSSSVHSSLSQLPSPADINFGLLVHRAIYCHDNSLLLQLCKLSVCSSVGESVCMNCIDYKDHHDYSPLALSYSLGYDDCVNILLSNGANPNIIIPSALQLTIIDESALMKEKQVCTDLYLHSILYKQQCW